jgi:transglutaminase-like putative cysteine protease
VQIVVRHRTRYCYARPVHYSAQTLRLTPQSFEGQRVVEWAIHAPGIEEALAVRDAFGNRVLLISVAGAHTETIIDAGGVVETIDRNGVVRGVAETVPLRIYLRQTPQTTANGAIRHLCASISGRGTIERLHELMHRIRDTVGYEIGATHAHTSAAEALSDRRGVCQDHAHIFIAAARTLGIPSRYVTGYLLVSGEAQAQAQHAWAESWVDDLGWVGFDVANGLCPTANYVRLAAGLDAGQAAPVRGCRRGGEAETLEVTVQVQQQSAQQ